MVSGLHGDHLSSQPMICQSKDKWIIMWLSSTNPENAAQIDMFLWINAWNPSATAWSRTYKCTILHQLLYVDVLLRHLEDFDSYGLVINTDAVHPADVGRCAGEDGGLPVGVAAGGGHKAGHTMDNPLAIDAAVQRATRVTLGTTVTGRAQSQDCITF